MTVVQHTKCVTAPALRQGFSFARKPLAVCRAVALALTATLLVSCVSARRAPYPDATQEKSSFIPQEIVWQSLTDYADYFCYENKAFPVRYHCVRIDLTAPGVQIVSYPQQSGAFKGKTTRAFAKETGAAIAVNATPFAGRLATKRTVGAHIADGTVFSAPEPRYDALVFEKTADGLRARIAVSQAEAALAQATYAFGGFWAVVRDGAAQDFAHTSYDARTAAGIAANGRTLYLLAVEKQTGLSFQQCADIFLALGATDAIQLDGGSSSDLVVHGKSVFARTARRRVGVSFGFLRAETQNPLPLGEGGSDQ